MNFLAEPIPPRGVALPVLPGIRRIVADNPGPMTYRGTNTYLLDWDDGVAVLDPGPDDAAHVRHILEAAGAPIRAIILTHGHHDHSGALPALHEATGAKLHAFPTLSPDIPVNDGDHIGPWRAMHTPGHAPDHLCLAGPDGIVFSGDHVMSWSSTVVGGAGGDMAAYFRSLERLLEVESSVYLPGHGPLLREPGAVRAGAARSPPGPRTGDPRRAGGRPGQQRRARGNALSRSQPGARPAGGGQRRRPPDEIGR